MDIAAVDRNTNFALTLSPDLSPCRRQGSAELHLPDDLRLPPLARLTAHDQGSVWAQGSEESFDLYWFNPHV